eukprot:scaffold266779_cov31-Tisochrysis_lutea.AAC.6
MLVPVSGARGVVVGEYWRHDGGLSLGTDGRLRLRPFPWGLGLGGHDLCCDCDGLRLLVRQFLVVMRVQC